LAFQKAFLGVSFLTCPAMQNKTPIKKESLMGVLTCLF
jgi:hypothetical protein